MNSAPAKPERADEIEGAEPLILPDVVTWLWWVTLAVTSLMVLTAFLPLLSVDWWWVRIGDYPRAQLLFSYLAGISALLPFCTRQPAWGLLALLVVSIGIQLYWIFPYLPMTPREVEQAQSDDPQTRLRIVTANVLQSNEDSAPLLNLIEREQPDVVVLCEVNERWLRDLASLEHDFSYRITHPLENEYGIALYSNLELIGPKVRGLVKDDIPSIDVRIRLRTGDEVRLLAVHPNPPRPGEDTTKRDAELVLAGREVRGEKAAIVLGDMNDVGWSRTTNLFQKVSGLLDPRKGRGMYATFDATSWFWRYPLDYLFHSDTFRVVELRVLPSIGSDHFPLLVELSHEPDASQSQEGPELSDDDRKDAREAVEAVQQPE